MVQTENAPAKYRRSNVGLSLGTLEENFDFSLIQNQLNAFLSIRSLRSLHDEQCKDTNIFETASVYGYIFEYFPQKSTFMVSRSEKEGNRNHFIGSDFLFRFAFLSVSIYPIHYSISLITFFPDKPGIGDSIPVCLGCCKIPAFGYNGTGRRGLSVGDWSERRIYVFFPPRIMLL